MLDIIQIKGEVFRRETLHVEQPESADALYKLVCWAKEEVPVPADHNWMAWNKSGVVYTYEGEPYKSERFWVPVGNKAGFVSINKEFIHDPDSRPEPGPWYEQLYWIGD